MRCFSNESVKIPSAVGSSSPVRLNSTSAARFLLRGNGNLVWARSRKKNCLQIHATFSPPMQKAMDIYILILLCSQQTIAREQEKHFLSLIGISRVYTLSSGCRADKQQSRNHLTEFRMLEAEIAFCESLDDLMAVPEDFLRFCIRYVLNTPDVIRDFQSLGAFSTMDHLSVIRSIVDGPAFPRLTFADAFKLLSDKNQRVTGSGLSKQNEAFLVEYHKSPVFITHFPSNQKPFYMLRSSNGDTTESFDLLCPGVCELAGGSIREPSAERLRERNSSIDWYAEIRERGKPISGGFGMGFERLLQLLLGIQNIKDTIPFPRWFKHCQC
ncbi:tRNA ligase class II [Ancylostoma caninum]|uniref:tRNA ligase class II n=1 Tax=Ancylostoma caninum TaxID=29170 RepID=A0A368H6W2_ANCCA|nr:tRNA ligase class II [Ancylostoma caninum]